MHILLSNYKKKRLPFPFLERATSRACGFSPAPAPRTLHLGTSFARWTSYAVLCPLAAVHFALRSRQTLCPFENNLFHRTYLCRSRFAEAEDRSFLRSVAALPAGIFAPCSTDPALVFSSPWAYPQQTVFRISRLPCLSQSQSALFLGKRSIPWLWRCAFCAAPVFDSGYSLRAVPWQPSGCPSSRWEFASMRSLRPKRSPSRGIMQISDLWILRFSPHFPFPNSRWVWNRALQTFGPWGHPFGCRWTENPCVSVFLRGPSLPDASAPFSSVSAFARRNSALRVSEKAGLWKKEFPSCFLFGSSGFSAASLPTLRQRQQSFRCACVVQL